MEKTKSALLNVLVAGILLSLIPGKNTSFSLRISQQEEILAISRVEGRNVPFNTQKRGTTCQSLFHCLSQWGLDLARKLWCSECAGIEVLMRVAENQRHTNWCLFVRELLPRQRFEFILWDVWRLRASLVGLGPLRRRGQISKHILFSAVNHSCVVVDVHQFQFEHPNSTLTACCRSGHQIYFKANIIPFYAFTAHAASL